MVMPATEYELQGEYELEGEWEAEWEGECEGECESEEFFRQLAAIARRQVSALQTPGTWQRDLALRAARAAADYGLPTLGGLAGGAIGGRAGRGSGRALGRTAAARLRGVIPARELEAESEWEASSFVNPLRRVYPDALMEHLAHAAAEAESEEEAEAFIGALIPLAARILPRAAPAIMRAAPRLIGGLTGITRTLRSSRATRPLVRTIPTIVRRTAADIARQSAGRRPVPPSAAVRTLARQTARVVGSPRQCAAAYQRSRALDRRYHHAVGPAAGPVCRCAARRVPRRPAVAR